MVSGQGGQTIPNVGLFVGMATLCGIGHARAQHPRMAGKTARVSPRSAFNAIVVHVRQELKRRQHMSHVTLICRNVVV
jgi:hypothetical protein